MSITEGEHLGEVRDIIYSAEAGAVVGFTLNKRGFFAGRRREVLHADNVHAIGHDAVMVTDSRRLSAPEDAEPTVAEPESDRNVLGNDVLTEAGARLGQIVDVVLETGAGQGRAGDVVGYEVKLPAGGNRYIPLPAQLSVSGTALVVPDQTERFVCDGLEELQSKRAELRRELGGDGD